MKRLIRYMTERPLSAGDSEEGSPIGWLFVVVGALSGAYFTCSTSPSPVKARLPIALPQRLHNSGIRKWRWRLGDIYALERITVLSTLLKKAVEWGELLTVERSDWHGHVGVPKGGRSRQLPMTQRLTAALKHARHLRSDLVLSCGWIADDARSCH